MISSKDSIGRNAENNIHPSHKFF